MPTLTTGALGRDQASQASPSLLFILGVFLLFTLVTLVFFWRWLPELQPQRSLARRKTNMQDFWNSWYVAVGGDRSQFFSTRLIRFPEGTPLYYHSFAYPKVFAIALLSKVFGTGTTTLLLLQNLSLLISFPIAGTGAYFLVRYFTPHTGPVPSLAATSSRSIPLTSST